jgi:hypothetical protein
MSLKPLRVFVRSAFEFHFHFDFAYVCGVTLFSSRGFTHSR